MKRVAVLLPVLLLLNGVAAAQQPCGMGAEGGAGMRGGMMGQTGRAGRMDASMMARMDSIDARLDSLQRRLNQASGSRKVGALADLLNALVDQHRDMHRMMREEMGGDGMPGMDHQMGPGGMHRGAGTGAMPCEQGGAVPAPDSAAKPPRNR